MASGNGPVYERHEVAAEVAGWESTYEVDEDGVMVISAAQLIGVRILGLDAHSAWPGRTFIQPELASTCTEHPERRLDCGSCYPLEA